MHTPPSLAVNRSSAILFWSTALDKGDTSSWIAHNASVVAFSMISRVAEILTLAFSSWATPRAGIRALDKSCWICNALPRGEGKVPLYGIVALHWTVPHWLEHGKCKFGIEDKPQKGPTLH